MQSASMARRGVECLAAARRANVMHGPSTAGWLFFGGAIQTGSEFQQEINMTAFVSHFSQVERAAEHMARSWPGGLPVTVVDSPGELPVPAPADVRGLFTEKRVFMVAATQDHIGVRRTMAHEVLGHHGFRQMLGASWPSFMVDVLAGARSGDAALATARAQVQRDYVNARGECELPAIQQADELVASVVEQRLHLASGRINVANPVRKVAAATVGRVAREWFCLSRPVSGDELEGNILASERRMRHGGPMFGLGGKLARWYSPRMSEHFPGPKRPAVDWDESKRLISNAKYHDGWWFRAKETFNLLVIGASILLLVWWVFAMASLIFR